MMTSTDDSDIDGSVECIVRSSNVETQGKRDRFEGCGGLGDRSDPHVTPASKGNLEAEQRRNNIMKDSSTSLKTNIGKDNLETVERETTKTDLLSRFKTYDDQLPSSSTANTQYEKLHHHSPKPSMRDGERSPGSLQGRGSSNDVVSKCLIRNDQRASQLQTPESQRPIDVSKKCPNMSDEGDSPSSSQRNKRYSRLWFGILRIMVILFSTASILAGIVTVFSGRMNIVAYILSSPVLWIVRCYMAVFHIVLILVELKIEVPIFIPKKTLDNFLHKGYLISFIGLIDSCMSSNKTLVQILDELQGVSVGPQQAASGYELQGGEAGWKILSAQSFRNKVCLAVLIVSSRGLMVCGQLYALLGLFGWTGESRGASNPHGGQRWLLRPPLPASQRRE